MLINTQSFENDVLKFSLRRQSGGVEIVVDIP